MAHPYHHALSSVRQWGGAVDDYQRIHDWFDESKMIIGFLGHASEFRPDMESVWAEQFLKACGRAADWGFKLQRHLLGAYRRVHEAAPPRRATSHIAALIDLVVAAPAVSAATVGRSLRITPHAARAMLDALEKRGLIYEITGRNSFRLYTAAPLTHLQSQAS